VGGLFVFLGAQFFVDELRWGAKPQRGRSIVLKIDLIIIGRGERLLSAAMQKKKEGTPRQWLSHLIQKSMLCVEVQTEGCASWRALKRMPKARGICGVGKSGRRTWYNWAVWCMALM
jgi:hypothetical protein